MVTRTKRPAPTAEQVLTLHLYLFERGCVCSLSASPTTGTASRSGESTMTDQSKTTRLKSATGKTSVVMRWRVAAAAVGLCFALVAGFYVTDARSDTNSDPQAPASPTTTAQR